jgi:hypothetical protein
MVFAVPEDFPSFFHLAKIFIADLPKRVSPLLGSFTSMVEVFPD